MNAKSIFCINTHYLYTNLRIYHGSIYAHYRKVGINYRSIGTSSCDWTKNVMSCVSCFYRKLKFLFDSRPFCNFDSAYSLFCRKKPVTILYISPFAIWFWTIEVVVRVSDCNAVWSETNSHLNTIYNPIRSYQRIAHYKIPVSRKIFRKGSSSVRICYDNIFSA